MNGVAIGRHYLATKLWPGGQRDGEKWWQDLGRMTYQRCARALQSRIRGGTFAAPVRPALKSGTAMRTTVKSGTAFAVPAGPSTPPLQLLLLQTLELSEFNR